MFFGKKLGMGLHNDGRGRSQKFSNCSPVCTANGYDDVVVEKTVLRSCERCLILFSILCRCGFPQEYFKFLTKLPRV